MKLRTKREILDGISERLKRQYFNTTLGMWNDAPWGPKERYEKLVALPPNATEAQYLEIVNTSWTNNKCNECGQDVNITIQLGEEPDYESSTAFICPDCLQKAIKLIKQ